MSSELWLTIYQSLSTPDSERFLDRNFEILSVSARNNSRDGITGLLVADNNKYFQAIEGPRDSVKACFERIKADMRHHDVELLIDRASDVRHFSRWSMGLVDALELSYSEVFNSRLGSASAEAVFLALVEAGREFGLVHSMPPPIVERNAPG